MKHFCVLAVFWVRQCREVGISWRRITLPDTEEHPHPRRGAS
jgi:hypothetical protein